MLYQHNEDGTVTVDDAFAKGTILSHVRANGDPEGIFDADGSLSAKAMESYDSLRWIVADLDANGINSVAKLEAWFEGDLKRRDEKKAKGGK